MAIILRPPRPGELGWIVSRHGALYHEEYGWDVRFEALVAEVVARFGKHHDPAREACWIAEHRGRPVGSVLLVQKSKRVAQLRLLLVEPSARGLGLGARLVEQCTTFARQAGYRRIVLWTNSVLTHARRLYVQAGYRKLDVERHSTFGKPLTAETWALDL